MKRDTTLEQQDAPSKNGGAKWQHAAGLAQLAKKNNSQLLQGPYESILWRLHAHQTDESALCIGISGFQNRAGATTIALNLAVCAASQHPGKILLIDANRGSDALQKKLRAPSGPGLFEILSGELSPREWEPIEVAEGIDFLSRGELGEDCNRPVRPQLAEAMLQEFREDYGLILVDLPLAEQLHNALPLAKQLNGVLLVSRFEATRTGEAERVVKTLQQDGVPVCGTVLNRHREYVPKWLQRWV